ncbi:uncharacterized protein A4U43_C05F28350 [Asparagus officinalis]|uniref:SDE2/SF3A3 SAP domain-containing protein n=2 Tax=Asparagus officinalis TaxID=4686 RepID=A0A5P1EZM1_ASPOF|nr:uncharacterized protein A4U43_C05F28350 [Asparagus officinalis]
MKIWMGKKKVDESDSDVDEDDDEDEDDKEKSVVLDDGSCMSHDKEEEGTSAAGLVSASSDGESSGRLSEQSNLDEVIGVSGSEQSSGGASENCNLGEVNGKCDFETPAVELGSVTGDSSTEADVLAKSEMGVSEEAAAQNSPASILEEVTVMKEVKPAETPVGPEIIDKETVIQTSDRYNSEEPLKFDEYNSAVELEILGMERLKAELQSRGLKCGGTLQEPKKVLAAKTEGK